MRTTTTHRTPARRAVVVERQSDGSGFYYRPVRVYLLLVDLDDAGEPIIPYPATRASDWTYVKENAKATRRMRDLYTLFNRLAASVNAGKISFDLAKEIIGIAGKDELVARALEAGEISLEEARALL